MSSGLRRERCTAPEYDAVIVGGGAAGLSAGLVLARALRTVLVVDGGEPRNAPAQHMHGFLSRDGLPPADLLAVGRTEVAVYGGQVVRDRVTGIRPVPGGGRRGEDGARATSRFHVELAGGRHVTGRRLLVATGLRDEIPDIPGLRERWAKDVLHCPYCHGWESRGRALGVLCDGSAAGLQYAQLVRQWSHDVVVIVPPSSLGRDARDQLTARRIDIVEDLPTSVLIEHDRLAGVRLADGRLVRREVLFVPPVFRPADELLAGLGCAFDGGWVVRDATGRTTVPGVWAAGNVANPRAQVITAAGEGSAAAIAINADLVSEDVALARGERDLTQP